MGNWNKYKGNIAKIPSLSTVLNDIFWCLKHLTGVLKRHTKVFLIKKFKISWVFKKKKFFFFKKILQCVFVLFSVF